MSLGPTPTSPAAGSIPGPGQVSEQIAAQTAAMGEANRAAALLSVTTAIEVIKAKAEGDALKNVR